MLINVGLPLLQSVAIYFVNTKVPLYKDSVKTDNKVGLCCV